VTFETSFSNDRDFSIFLPKFTFVDTSTKELKINVRESRDHEITNAAG